MPFHGGIERRSGVASIKSIATRIFTGLDRRIYLGRYEMKNGDVVFFKRAKPQSRGKAQEVHFKGHAFGVLLGHVPPFQKDPPPEHLLRLMGTIGFLSFDDVGEFFGPEIGADAVKKFEDKYYGKVVEDPNAPKQEELPLNPDAPATGLVGLDGAPLQSEPAQPEGDANGQDQN